MILHDKVSLRIAAAGNYMYKVDNRNTRRRCEICSKLTIKIPERRLAFFISKSFSLQNV